MSQSEQVREAAQRVYVAALGRAHAEEAYGGRETPGASHSLDYAHDEWAEALDGHVAARNTDTAEDLRVQIAYWVEAEAEICSHESQTDAAAALSAVARKLRTGEPVEDMAAAAHLTLANWAAYDAEQQPLPARAPVLLDGREARSMGGVG